MPSLKGVPAWWSCTSSCAFFFASGRGRGRGGCRAGGPCPPSDEEEAEENRHGHFVGFGEVAGAGPFPAAPLGQSACQAGDHLAVNAIAQAFGQFAGKTARLLQEDVEAAAGGKGVAGEDEPQIGGVGVGQQGGVDFEVALGAAAPPRRRSPWTG